MKRCMFVVAALVALALTGSARAQTFTLGFEIDGAAKKTGAAGETKTWDVYPILTTADNANADGAQGWQVGLSVTGGNVDAITLKGVTVNCIYDEDPGDGSPVIHHDPYWQDLSAKDMFAKGAAVATLESDPTVKGAIMYAVFRSAEHMVLQPTGTARLAKMTVSAVIPEQGCVPVVLHYLDGMKSDVSKPVVTAVTFNSDSIDSTKGLVTQDATLQACVIGKVFNLALVPYGKMPTVVGEDEVLEKKVPPGDALIDVGVVLTTQNLPAGDGPQGWQIGGAIEPCMGIEVVTQKGVIVNTIYDEDPGDGTPVIHHENWPQDLSAKDMFAKGASKATLDTDASVNGFISYAVFKSAEHQVLYANAQDTILKIQVKVPGIVEGAQTTCKIRFLDSMKSDVSKPVINAVTYQSDSIDQTKDLTTNALTLKLTGGLDIAAFQRGEANGDKRINIADAVYVVYAVLKDPIYPMPCPDAGDADANQRLEFSDAIFLINYQFMNGPPPVAPTACAVDPASTPESCAASWGGCK